MRALLFFFFLLLCFTATNWKRSVSLQTLMKARGCKMFFLSSHWIKHQNDVLLVEGDHIPLNRSFNCEQFYGLKFDYACWDVNLEQLQRNKFVSSRNALKQFCGSCPQSGFFMQLRFHCNLEAISPLYSQLQLSYFYTMYCNPLQKCSLLVPHCHGANVNHLSEMSSTTDYHYAVRYFSQKATQKQK